MFRKIDDDCKIKQIEYLYWSLIILYPFRYSLRAREKASNIQQLQKEKCLICGKIQNNGILAQFRICQPSRGSSNFPSRLSFHKNCSFWEKKTVYLMQTCTETVNKTCLGGILSYLYLFVLPYFLQDCRDFRFKVCHELNGVFKLTDQNQTF